MKALLNGIQWEYLNEMAEGFKIPGGLPELPVDSLGVDTMRVMLKVSQRAPMTMGEIQLYLGIFNGTRYDGPEDIISRIHNGSKWSPRVAQCDPDKVPFLTFEDAACEYGRENRIPYKTLFPDAILIPRVCGNCYCTSDTLLPGYCLAYCKKVEKDHTCDSWARRKK